MDQETASLAVFSGLMMFFGFVALVAYVYSSLCLMKIAQRLNEPNAWLAWIPFVNVFLMLKLAEKPLWWFLLSLLPPISIVIFVIVWMRIAVRLGKPEWWGILVIVPGVQIIVPGYLAFA